MHSATSAVDLSDRDNEETLVVKEEETYDAGALEEVEAEVVQLLKHWWSHHHDRQCCPLDHL